ncbi:GES-1 protein [Aphelenchoides avenae]|nr:GES-1 protein [Aphelenchus avenae]
MHSTGVSTALLVLFGGCLAQQVTVRTGALQGIKLNLSDGSVADVFLNIPYAKPPIGELRFEKPQPPDAWTGIRDASNFGPACIPHSPLGVVWPVSEDCLSLNVIRPSKPSLNGRRYPVLFWIHPSAYASTGALVYGYKGVAENFAPHNIIVVTIQHRLGPLGFLSTGDKVLPGNLGLFDQAAALKWTHENIAAFGGDNKRITVWGMSAGAASGGHFGLSPYTQNLFSQSIQMSGSYYSTWTTGDIVNVTRSIAVALGCPERPAKLKPCLKNKTVDELYDAVEATGDSRRSQFFLNFHPRLDGDFFPADFPTLLDLAPPKPTILGIAQNESLFFTTLNYFPTVGGVHIDPSKFDTYSDKDLEADIKDRVVPKRLFGAKSMPMIERLVKFYVKRGATNSSDNKFYLARYSQLMTDLMFRIPLVLEVREKRKHKWQMHLYENEHFNPAWFPATTPLTGPIHTIETQALFGMSLLSPTLSSPEDEQDRVQHKLLVDAFASFVKNGKPSVENASWPQSSKANPLAYLRLKPNPKAERTLDPELLAFWDEFFADFGRDIVLGKWRHL